MPTFDRPREKMQDKGPQNLSDIELLAVLIGSGIKGKGVLQLAKDILKIKDLIDKKQEYFFAITLDGVSNLIQKRVVFIGTLNQSIVHPREIFADAVLDRAASIIFVHNHPSGSLGSNREDIEITDRITEVGKIIGIEVLDHIIVAKNGHFSFQRAELLSNKI